MAVPKFFIIPAALLAVTAGYIALNPEGKSAGRVEPDGSSLQTATARPEAGATRAAAATPRPALLPGLTGRLTYRTLGSGGARERITVQFPSGDEVARAPEKGGTDDEYSADGTWRTHMDCRSPSGCVQSLVGPAGRALPLDGELRWARTGHRYAMRIYGDGNGAPDRLVLDDPETGTRAELTPAGVHIYGFDWDASGDGVVAAVADDSGGTLSHFDAAGSRHTLASIATLPPYLYRSPDGTKFAFTAAGDAGWRMMLVDATTNAVRDLGPMGSDGPDGRPVTLGPDQKGPMYIAWSPDGETIAFGGGFDPPYVMRLIDLHTGGVLTTQFPDGYPGEIKWSPSGQLLAVSTYNIPRTHHESWIVDPATGAARDLLSGCVIVWSPDGKFLAIHGEKEPGVAIADVETLQHVQLTHTVGDTPIAWER